MAATEMNFGPEWLRALQDGMPKGSNSNSSSSSLSNSIIASSHPKPTRQSSVKFRYSCEEMLMFYTRDNCYPPKDLIEHDEVFVEKVQDPLLFTEPTIEEINLLSQSINSDCIVKKNAKENGESTNEDRENRAKSLLNAVGSDGVILRKPPGMSGVTASPLSCLAGMFSERGNGHPLRPGRGGNVAERGSRTGLRNTGSLFGRVSSYDESSTTTTRANTVTAATLLTSKKVGLQRSSTENSTSSSAAIPNMFAPAWRTTNNLTSTSNTATASNSTAIEQKSEWRSNSDASKNWREANSKAPNVGSKTPPTKDFFEGEDSSNSWDAHTREYLQRKRGMNPANKVPSKPFARRFDSDNNDLFKSKGNFEAFQDSYDMMDDRDLFGGERHSSTSRVTTSTSESSYEHIDLFSGGGASTRGGKSIPLPNATSRFNRDRGGEYGPSNNDKWNHGGGKSFGSNDGRTTGRYPGQHYNRTNSHANEDDDRFGSFGDDDDYRRNSLPEWSLDDPSDMNRVGTFDASGAFHEASFDDDAAGGDKTGDERKRGRQEKATKAEERHNTGKEFDRADPSRNSASSNGDGGSSLKKDGLASEGSNSVRRPSENQNRSSQPLTASSMANLDKPKVDYFNLSDPSLSPSAKPKKDRHIHEEDSFAQLEKDTHHLLSKLDVDDDGDTSVLLSNQLSNLLKDDSPGGGSHSKSRPSNQQQQSLHGKLSQGENLGFLQDRYQFAQPNSAAQQQSLFSSSLMNQLVGRDGNSSSGPTNNNAQQKEDPSELLLNSRLTSSGSLSSQNKIPVSLTSMLNDNFGFNFGSPSAASSAEHAATSQSLFSSLSGQQQQQQSSVRQQLSSFDLDQLESNESSNSGRLGLGILHQQKQRERKEEPSRNESTVAPAAAPSKKMSMEGDMNEWFYRDPQGTVQGPFTPEEMYDWFVNGYFSMDLLVRRGSETSFSKLGELYQLYKRVPFLSLPTPYVPPEPSPSAAAPGSFLFGGSLLSTAPHPHLPHPSPLGPTIVPTSPGFLHHQGQTSPPLHLPQQQPQAPNHLPFSVPTVLDNDLNKPAGSLGSLFESNSQPKEEHPPSSVSGSSSLLNMFQRQHSQPQPQPSQPISQPQSDNQIANLLGFGPQNALQAQTQLRLILAQLMKNERFHLLSAAQQQQIVMEKFIQLNSQNAPAPANQFQQPPPSSDHFHSQSTRPTEQPHSIDMLPKAPFHHEEILQQQQVKAQHEEHQTPPPPPQSAAPQVESFEGHVAPSHSLQLGPQSPPIPVEHDESESQPKPNPLQILHAAMAAKSNSTTTAWAGNIVPGAMSLSDVEELQRREAEARYNKLQQQQQQQPEEEEEVVGEFEHKVERKRQAKTKTADQSAAVKQSSAKVEAPKPQPTQQSGKVQVIDSKPVEPIEKMHPQASSNVPSQPKKSAWGKTVTETVTSSPAMSIAEIQKLQEEKEREEEEKRQQALEQMASFIATQQQQQQQQQQAGRPPLKWASQSWKQEEGNSKIKTLAEIQAEEAEKAAVLRAQQEAEARRRIAANTSVTPLSAIVAKGSNAASVWNTPATTTHKSSGIWDDDDNPTPAAAAAMAPATASNPAVKKSTKVDSALIKQILKTNPKNVKKLEEAHLNRLGVESTEELLRYSVDILNKAFDSIDAQGFMSIVKDLSSPNEVVEYMQNYLGNSQSAMYFAKFYISKKSYLFNKSKQENAERLRQQQQSAKSTTSSQVPPQRQSGGIWDDDDDEAGSYRGSASSSSITYKNVLNQHVPASVSTTSSVQKKSNSTQATSAKTKSANSQAKTKVAATTAIENDANIMNATVESMEEFDNWCMEVLKQNFDQNIDAETFISFLKAIDAPFEINEYVNTYLGNSKVSRDFAKNFINKRSYLRNKNKGEQHEDLCGPAYALNPSNNKSEGLNDNNGFVTVNSSSKKKKKGRNNSSQQSSQPQQPTTTIHTATLNDL